MALTKPKKKAKKNPYRLSSDRQPGIKEANKGKRKRKGIRDLLDELKKKGFGPFAPRPKKPKRYLEPQPYRPKRFKDFEKYYQLLKAKPKSGQAKPASKNPTKKRGGGIAKRGMGKAK
tara:strand:- start:633 stop:986 length:354 start_codon:yes stop_codon:yes gene_type:complete